MTSPVTTSAASNAIWDALYNLLLAQAIAGGKLASVKSVIKGAQFARELVPAIAIDLESWASTWQASRRRRVAIQYKIYAAASSTQTDARVANLVDARASLASILDDGTGNGIEPIFGAMANFAAGNIAWSGYLKAFHTAAEIREGEGQEVWAYGIYDYEAITFVTV